MFPGSEPGSAFMRILSFSADNHTHMVQQSPNDFSNALLVSAVKAKLKILGVYYD